MLDEAQALPIYSTALEQAEQEQQRQMASMLQQPPTSPTDSSSDTSTSTSSSNSPSPVPGWQRLRVHAGGRVDGVLVSAFDAVAAALSRSGSSSSSSSKASSSLSGSEGETSSSNSAPGFSSETAIAARCWELLSGMATPLAHDLWVLRKDAQLRGEEEEVQRMGHLFVEQVRGRVDILSFFCCFFCSCPSALHPAIH